jgi:cardiolipin synthase
VQVAVAVPRNSDVPIVTYASRHLYAGLLARGVRIFEWPHAMLHAKTAVIDDAWSVVGSYNLDRRSFFHQLEAVVLAIDPAFAGRLCAQTLADVQQCREVTRAAHKARPWHQKLLESLAYLFRDWL